VFTQFQLAHPPCTSENFTFLRLFAEFSQFVAIMSGEDLLNAVQNNQPAEVVRLLDEEDVDVNCGDDVSFFCVFFASSFLFILK
jgi:hypothetical protein